MKLEPSIAGMSHTHLLQKLDRGARLVSYQYCISLIFVTFRRTTDIYLIPPGQNPVIRGLPFTLLTFVAGWWGIPWGFIYTPKILYRNLAGGSDLTATVRSTLMPASSATEFRTAVTPPQPARRLDTGRTVKL